jgi:hypothetical protein
MKTPCRKNRANLKAAVAYLRVSTEDQQLGPEAQRAAIEAWAAREGVQVVAWHLDQGVSGGADVEDRPGLVAALRVERAGILLVAKRDRLARESTSRPPSSARWPAAAAGWPAPTAWPTARRRRTRS